MKKLLLIILFPFMLNAQGLLLFYGDETTAVDTGTVLLDSLVAYYKMDEASGTRTDEINSYNLTEILSVDSRTGKVGDAAQYVNSAVGYLERGTNSDLALSSTDWTIACWTYLDTDPGNDFYFLVAKDSLGKRGYGILYAGGATDEFGILIGNNTASNNITNASDFGTPSIPGWFFVVGRYQVADDSVWISVNNTTTDDVSSISFVSNDRNLSVGIGKVAVTSTDLDGAMDEVGIWRRKLTDNEITFLYNNGAGCTYTGGKIVQQ